MEASERLPQQFNIAAHFVDGNVAEGRAGAPAFHCDDRVLTYGDVQDLTNRTGNVLRDLGVEMEGRVLVLCLDAPEFLGTLGVVPDLRVFHLQVEEGQALAFLIVVKDTSEARPRAARCPRACWRCC